MARRTVRTAVDLWAATEALKARTREIEAACAGAGAKEIYDTATAIHGRSVALAPVDTGDLRGSGYLLINGEPEGVSFQDGRMVVEIGFASPYAWNQHEHPEYEHPKGGQAFFLETAFDEAVSGLSKRIAENTKAVIRHD